MKTTSHALVLLAMFISAPVFISAATAQVSIGVDRDGPQIRGGRDTLDRYRDEDRRRHDAWSNQANCRNVTLQKRGPDGAMTTQTTRRCD